MFTQKMEDKLKTLLQNIEKWQKLPEETYEEQQDKKKRFAKDIKESEALRFLRQVADLQIAQFFIPKTIENQDLLITDGSYFKYLNQKETLLGNILSKTEVTALEKQFFHWFVEFPEIFLKVSGENVSGKQLVVSGENVSGKQLVVSGEEPLATHHSPLTTSPLTTHHSPLTSSSGFDCILGNPPFLGGLRLSTNYGFYFLNYIHTNFYPTKGTSDLVTYFSDEFLTF